MEALLPEDQEAGLGIQGHGRGRYKRPACTSPQSGVVLIHGGRFDKESWKGEPRALADAEYRILAFGFRNHDQSRGPTGRPTDEGRRFDVLVASRYRTTVACH
jgi:pimeloyl-ACP methyl ester carboxylesterase